MLLFQRTLQRTYSTLKTSLQSQRGIFHRWMQILRGSKIPTFGKRRVNIKTITGLIANITYVALKNRRRNTGVRVVKNVVRIILITLMFNFNNVLQRTHAHGPLRTRTHTCLPLKTMFCFEGRGKTESSTCLCTVTADTTLFRPTGLIGIHRRRVEQPAHSRE